jgi:hypothetical protein
VGEGSGLGVVKDDGSGGSRTGSDVLLKPGNTGGGKGPDFWCAFEDGEGRGIGDEP